RHGRIPGTWVYTLICEEPTNGKVERFHRTMADGWAYARCYRSEHERRDALNGWLHHYNQHRPHTACGNQPPFSRLINVPDQYI
ncbi:integrase core domain-containing protein, partial [Brevibacterium yomogidense]|uniref:integrase core domain-containing protein n=1 Tax=Brevibacterium yomogidense TaxID=946573 RepID=UPI00117877C5